jgi:hypothetical protein
MIAFGAEQKANEFFSTADALKCAAVLSRKALHQYY